MLLTEIVNSEPQGSVGELYDRDREKGVDLSEHQPMYANIMYHTGQYLFFIPISTRPATQGGEWRYQDK